MKSRGFTLVLAVLAALTACLVAPHLSWGAETCYLSAGTEEYDLRSCLDVLEDPERSLTIEDVASRTMAEQFGPPSKGHFNFGFTASALWFRFTIAQKPDASGAGGHGNAWVFDPGWNVYDTIQLYVPKTSAPGGWQIHSAGNLLSETGGPERRHFFLPENLTAPLTCYLRVTGIRPMMVSPHIATIERTMRVNSFKILGTGLVIGYFLTMALGHLFVYLYAGIDKFKWSIPGNLGFASFVALTSYQHLVSFERLTAMIMVVGLVTQGFPALVIRAVMDTRIYNRTLDRFLLGSVFLVFTAAVVGPFLPEHLHGSISMRVVTPVAFIGAWACVDNLKRNRTVSIIFLAAWGGTVLDMILYNRAANGGVPFMHPMMTWVGFIGEALAMSFLLAYFTATISLQRQTAEAVARAKSTFLASMSHEIRTPMTAIPGFLNLAMQSGATGQLRQYLLKIRTSARHLLGIINDILDVSKIEEGKVRLESKPFEVETLLLETADIMVPRAFENGDELVVTVEADVPRRVMGDPLRLGQVLVNLGGNAVKFTQGGTVHMAVSLLGDGDVQAQEGQAVLRFQVIDTGIGIEPEVLPRLFQSFEQAHSSTTRVFGGTGLGLDISRRLVQLMGGDIAVRSVPGAGSTFEFSVPFALSDDECESPSPTRFEGLKVLLAEDNPVCRAAAEAILRQFGMRFRTASTAAEAIRFAGEERFDLVLLDWDLPDASGSESSVRLHGTEPNRQTPVVYMSSLARPEMEGFRPERSGGAAVLSKPFTPSAVEEMLRMLVLHEEAFDPDGETLRAQERRNLELVRGMRILVVDDNAFNRELFEVMLTQAGAQLETAANGKDAVRRLLDARKPLPDVVLMDVHMPGMDGYEAARRIRADARCAALPIVALTADVIAENRDRCFAAGMNNRLTKPVEASVLFEALGSWGRSLRNQPECPGNGKATAGGL